MTAKKGTAKPKTATAKKAPAKKPVAPNPFKDGALVEMPKGMESIAVMKDQKTGVKIAEFYAGPNGLAIYRYDPDASRKAHNASYANLLDLLDFYLA